MCGLVGVAGNLFQKDYKAFKWMLNFDAIRGEHSTGVASISDDGKDDLTLTKQVGVPEYLYVANPLFKNGVWDGTSKALIGHNRYATIGAVTPENAHPFHHQNIVGAHNGTLEYMSLFRLDNGYKFDVDSEAVIYNMAINGVKDTIEQLEGAWAFVWYNFDDNTLNFIRNEERDLYYARSKDKDGFYWASEKWMIQVACSKMGLSVEEPVLFKTNTHYSIDLNVCDARFRSVELKEVEVIKGYSRPFHPVMGGGIRSTGNTNYSSNFASMVKKNMASHIPNVTHSEVKNNEKKLREFIGKDINFFVDGEWEGKNKQPYIKASPFYLEKFDYEVRVYGGTPAKRSEWKNSSACYTGRVKRVVRDGHTLYVLVDTRTVVEYIKPEPTTNLDRDWYDGFNGAKLSLAEFYRCTKDGCSYCSSSVTPQDKVQFTSHDTFLCEDCLASPAYETNILPFIQKAS